MAQDIKQVVARNLSAARANQGMKLEELAKKTKISIRTLTRAENEPQNLTIETLDTIAKGLGEPITKFFESYKPPRLTSSKTATIKAIDLVIGILKNYRDNLLGK